MRTWGRQWKNYGVGVENVGSFASSRWFCEEIQVRCHDQADAGKTCIGIYPGDSNWIIDIPAVHGQTTTSIKLGL